MSFTYPSHQYLGQAAELMMSHDTYLIIVDEAEQLDKNSFAALCILLKKTGCHCVLFGDARRIWLHTYSSASLAIHRCFSRFWSRRKKRHV